VFDNDLTVIDVYFWLYNQKFSRNQSLFFSI